ncbi:hypothetical protein RND81_06G034400 [Saponaria officinalis]|uniref:HAT C-terminal dimerisation domain-containing protein n=1 Tax=Saponaria officinalis TaxID=3572 RepID=A0AAW1K6X5_SAPOF
MSLRFEKVNLILNLTRGVTGGDILSYRSTSSISLNSTGVNNNYRAERAFSAMKLIKTALRNRMEDDYLTDSLIVYVEKGIAKEFDIDSIIDEFASKKDRRSLLKISKTNK